MPLHRVDAGEAGHLHDLLIGQHIVIRIPGIEDLQVLPVEFLLSGQGLLLSAYPGISRGDARLPFFWEPADWPCQPDPPRMLPP